MPHRGYFTSLAVGVLTVGIAGAESPSPKPAGGAGGPLSVYRSAAAFDPDGRVFSWGQPVLIPRLHDEFVHEFINRPGAGVGRMPALPMAPQVWVELVRESLSEAEEPTSTGKPQPPRYDELKETLVLPDGSKRTVRERIWVLRDHRLMSVNAKSGPAVYQHDAKADHDRMKSQPVATSKNTPTRKLDDFETRALPHLRDGDDVALHSSASEMRVLGAIRARGECLECHKTKAGELLGAFTYTLALQSDATPEADCLKDVAGLSRTAVGAVHFVESQGGKVVRMPGGPIREVYFTHTWTQNAERLAKEASKDGIYRPSYARLKNSSLAVLESLPDLRVLDVSHSMVTDDGLKEIAKLKTLRKVVYSPGYITEAGVAELKKALPDCVVEQDAKSLLPVLP